MFQTSYQGIIPLSNGIGYNGGFCRFYYAPKEWVTVWPAIDPLTQYLSAEPELQEGKTWYGPIKIPNGQLGYEEETVKAAGGICYKEKISGFHPGDSGNSRINLENMPWHEYIVVAKQRAGGLFLIIGNDERGMDYTANYASGPGVKKVAGSEIAFETENQFKALILPAFLGENVIPPDDGFEGNIYNNDANQTEIIPFTADEATKEIAWDATRKSKFGVYPEIQLWQYVGAGAQIISLPISVDLPPPDNTLFTVFLPGTAGFIVLK